MKMGNAYVPDCRMYSGSGGRSRYGIFRKYETFGADPHTGKTASDGDLPERRDPLRECITAGCFLWVDGAENNWPSYESAGHYEVAKYFTVDEHSRVPEAQIASQYTWNKLPEEYQKIIRECAEESARYERNQWKIRESISRQRVEANGCIVTQLSPEEKQRFQQAVMPLYEKYCAEYVDIIDEIVAEGR